MPTALLIAAGLALYLVGARTVFPLLAPRLMAHTLEQKLARPVTIARAEWRPLATRLVLHNGIIGPRQDDPYDRVDPLLSFRSLELDFSLLSLWRRGQLWPLLTVDQGYAHLVREEDRSFNLSPPATFIDSRLLPGRVEIINSRLEYTDRTQEMVFNQRLNNFTATWQRPGGRTGELAFDLRGQGPAASRLALQGTHAEHTWQARLEVAKIPLPALDSYLGPLLGTTSRGGELDGTVVLNRQGERLRVQHDLVLRSWSLAHRPDKPDHALPLLQALLTDEHRQLPLKWEFDLPSAEVANRTITSYRQELARRIDDLVATAERVPQTLLAGEFPELTISTSIAFRAGRAELSREAGRQLDQLAAALGQRPLLTLQLQGFSDPTCDRDALREQQEQALRHQQRQAVAALARRLAAEKHDPTTATAEPGEATAARTAAEDPATLRPGGVTISDAELLALAGQRQEVVLQRLGAALGEDQRHRLQAAAPALAQRTTGAVEPGCAAAVHLRPGSQPVAAD